MSDDQQHPDETPETSDDEQDEAIHFVEDFDYIEDLEERKNASGPATTMAVGEEDGGGSSP
jgi:hypothetical protein